MRLTETMLGKYFSSLIFWKLNFIAWLAVCIACILAKVYFYPDLHSEFYIFLANFLLAFFLSSLLRYAYRKTNLSDFFEIKALFFVTLCSLSAGFIHSELTQNLINHMKWGRPGLPTSLAFSNRFFFISALFIAWSLGYFGLRAKVEASRAIIRSKQARAKARHMELQLLRNRIDPHFLFNSLNGIAAEITPHPDTASELIHDVSDYLRYLLDHRDQSSCLLSEELDAMTAYLKIEQSRFGERLHTSIVSTRTARKMTVPCFLLQSLVENAVKHARWPENGPLEITISAKVEGDTLFIKVTNTGTLLADTSDGVGLSTLRRLLDLQYPQRHKFSLLNDHARVQASLQLQGIPCSVS